MRFQREMPGVEELNRCVWIVSQECLCPGRNEIRIEFPPHSEQGRLRGPEILLKLRIHSYIVGVIKEQIELNVHISGTRKQGGVQRVTLGLDKTRIGDTGRILMAESFQVQSASNGVPILQRGFAPIALDRPPRV